MIPRLIRKAVWTWTAYRMRKQRERAMPELRALRVRREEARKHHRNAAMVERQLRNTLHQAMGGPAL